MNRLKGKVALVTGGARGLGAAFVRLLAAEGAKVAVTDIVDAPYLKRGSNGSIIFIFQDVRSEATWTSVISTIEGRFGPISVLVNNAGVTSPSVDAELNVISLETYEHIVAVNQVGVFLGMKHILPSMLRAGGGSIINMSSVAGLVGKEHTIGYAASKFAVRGMTKVAAVEYGRHNIRVNSIHPGPIETQMLYAPDGSYRPVVQRLIESLPAGRFGRPEEIAQMVLLLASDEMSFATGAEFIIDGGMTCG